MTSFNLFPEPFTNAMGWALVHTLWQGTVFAAAAALALRVSQNRSSFVRYGISIGALALQLLTFLLTVWICYEPVRATLQISGEQQPSLVMTPSTTGNWTGELTSWLNSHFPLLVTAWFCGAALLMVRLVGGWVLVQRLTRRNVHPVAQAWQSYLNQLSNQLGIGKTVRLIESAEIAVPMTIGWLKPVVLLPIGLLTGLSTRQVEAVLAHELAHIKRYDYLVNLIQSAVEIVLFFHPAIWWLSARVREEREHCCDDVAIRFCGERASLAQALVHIEERRQAVLATPALAMAFGARKQTFVQRVKRVIGVNDQQSTAKPNGLLVAGCLVLITGLVTGQHLYRPVKGRPQHGDSITINAWKSKTDTLVELSEPQEITLSVPDKSEPPFVFAATDTIDPVTRIRLEKELEYHTEQMKRLEREMGKLTPQFEHEQLLALKNNALELADLEQEKVTMQLQKMQLDLERNVQRTVELEQKRAQLNGKLSQEETRRLEKAQQDAQQMQKKLEQLNEQAFAKSHQKLQELTEGSLRLLNDSMSVFNAKAAKLANMASLHAVEMLRLKEKLYLLDTLRARADGFQAVPDVPALEAVPSPVPAIAPVPGPAPRPGRLPKPAKVKGAYWYNGKRYNSPEEMPKEARAAYPPPAPPAVTTVPPVPADAPVSVSAPVPVVVAVPVPPEPAVAPEPGEGVWYSDGKKAEKAKSKSKLKSKAPKPAKAQK
ncbi:M56 family metallopeptidase [Larkinella terrae]|uniref:M48 family metalloprotease n=1 Tax=Larkinella terrae TaxID=2025311 RepID=A0A7K0EQ49_9BACT|nr:M56 family metallopeptidase [Larkinella terrae]MRS63872.1 M48 family metalloprotease [Larkinella terrae]